jgi:cob(I)alamin adenosyltransferase
MGFLHVYTGDGKGKTTAAIGLAIRAAGAGKSVAFVQFDKGGDPEDERYSERNILRSIAEIELFTFGCQRVRPDGTFRFGITDEDRAEAERGLEFARQLIRMPHFAVIILDEIISAASTGLIPQEDLAQLILEYKQNPVAELVLTGRGASPVLRKMADLVTDMQARKHYFSTGVKARKGIDY